MIKVSIIVPVFNTDKKLLTRCLKSLVNQTLEDIEIILVDDASTSEDTVGILNIYANKYEKIILLTHSVNKKQGGARNSGLEIARGKFIGFVDADDYIDINMYKLLYFKGLEDTADIVDCDYLRVTENGDIIKKWISVKDVTDANEYLIYPGPIWAKIYSKKMIIKNKLFFPENMFYEDNAISGIHFLYAKKISKVSQYLYYYVQHASSTVSNSKFTISDKVNAGTLYMNEIIKRELFYKYKEIVLARYFRIYFLNTYKSLMMYRKDYYSILRQQMDNLDEYGVDINHILIQKQLRQKHKFKLFLLYNLPKIFQLYTKIKYWKIQKVDKIILFKSKVKLDKDSKNWDRFE